jgi:curved DNA-binding protein CbpA
MVKDYYTILGIPAGSSPEAVKKAYRRLVMRFHPDKTGGDAYTAAYFREVQEAYDVLSDPLRREDYHQQRSLWKATGKAFDQSGPLTPDLVLRQAVRLHETVRVMDRYRMDQEGIGHSIQRILRDAVGLTDFRDLRTNAQIVHFLLLAAEPLPRRLLLAFREPMEELASGDDAVLGETADFFRRKKREQVLTRYQTPLLILAALALCYLAYRLSR